MPRAMGGRTLLRRFRQATGLKSSEYFQNVRVSRAQEALEFSTHTVEEITTMVGYRDYSAFRQVFKKVIELTPTKYRSRSDLWERAVGKCARSGVSTHNRTWRSDL